MHTGNTLIDPEESTARKKFMWRYGVIWFGIPTQFAGALVSYHFTYGSGKRWEMLQEPLFWITAGVWLMLAPLSGRMYGAAMWDIMGRGQYLRKRRLGK